MRAAVLALVLAACGSESFELGVCGNGIVEPGEDCDGSDVTGCIACGLACGSTEDCRAYSDAVGFVCGPDGFCHAPTGTFAIAGEATTSITRYTVTDVDHDGAGDVLGHSQTAVSVLFGDATASITRSTSMQTPFAQGEPYFSDLDGDGSADVLLPTADGIVAYTAPAGLPAPFPFPSFVPADMANPMFVHPILDREVGVISTLGATTQLGYFVLDPSAAPPQALGAGPLCNADVTELAPSDIDVFELAPGHQIVALTLHAPGGTPRLCAIDVARGATSYTITPLAITPTGPPVSRPVLANLRGEACPSLLVGQGVIPVTVEYRATSPSPPCSFSSTGSPLGPFGSTPVGFVPLVPALAGAAPNALVLSTGVYQLRTASGQLEEVFRSQRTIAASQAVDLDGDGALDLVTAGQRTEDFELLQRIAPGFIPKHFTTAAPVERFLTGDFDGNRIVDLAFVEAHVGTETLVIAYGTRDGLLPGVIVGTFDHVRSLIRTQFPDSTDRFAVIDDLAVLFDRGTTTAELALLHGSPERTMLAFFDPRDPPIDPTSMFRGVVAGYLRPDSNGNDVLAIEGGTPSLLWLSSGANTGELQAEQPPSTATVLQACGGVTPASDPFCIEDAHYVAWPIGDTFDYAIGVSREQHVIGFDPSALVPDAEAAVAQWRGALGGPANAEPVAVRAVRLEDGSRRLIVSFGPAALAPSDVAAVSACTFDPATGPVCTELSGLISERSGVPWTCVDAGVGRVAAARRFEPPDRDGDDYVVLCRGPAGDGELFRVSIDFTTVAPLAFVAPANVIELGDVTGDGIVDVILLDTSAAIPQLRILRQCNSRDIAGDCEGEIEGAL
ncbi:MAG TPA: VCBS repeat-containing protein [Kofleriaceae bacterium]|nr:VCBS repeat-containing protein [Kofleriaceae bacterium]